MKKSTFYILAFASLILPLAFSSCIHDNFEEPPEVIITKGNQLNIDQIYQIYNDSILNLGKQLYKFTDDYSVTGVIIMDDKSGNLYKSAYVQDGSKGINLHLMSSGGLYQGDSIRIKLKGLTLSLYSGMMQLDSVYVDASIVKIATMRDIEPEVVTISQILTGQYDAKLIKLENVQFRDVYLGKTYADKENLLTLNRSVENEVGDSVIIRTSGYASFAGRAIPEGRGSLIAVVGKFNNDWQLFVRTPHEVVFDDRRFGDVDSLFYESFASAVNGSMIDLDGWKNIDLIGSLKWMGYNNGEDAHYAKIDGTGSKSACYLVLPQQVLSSNKMTFRTRAGSVLGARLELVISTDYDGSNFADATWNIIPASIATGPSNGYGSWLESGQVDLSGYSGNAYIAFRYVAAVGDRASFIIDDILIYK